MVKSFINRPKERIILLNFTKPNKKSNNNKTWMPPAKKKERANNLTTTIGTLSFITYLCLSLTV